MPSLLGLALLATAVMPSVAQAQDEPAPSGLDALPREEQRRFEKLANRCIEAYDSGKFDSAETLCLEAASITPHPSTLFVRARIRDRTRRCREAVELYSAVLETVPAGPAEAKFLEDYRDDATAYLESLGDCSARIELACAERGMLVAARGPGDSLVLTACPGVLATEAGEQTLTLLARGSAPMPVEVDGIAGKSIALELEPPPERGTSAGTVSVEVACPELGPQAALLVDDVLVGLCPDTVPLTPGRHRLEAVSVDGSSAVAIVDADAAASAPLAVALPRLYRVRFDCDDPAVRVRFDHPLVSLDTTCEDLASGPGLELPAGSHTLALSDDEGRALDLPLEVPGAQPEQAVRIAALDNIPVPFEITCADAGGEPPVYVRIGDQIGRCPMQGSLPMGPYTVEARREGYERWTGEVQLSHREPRVEVPALEENSFWGAGSITALSGGALLLTAVAIDLAGQSDLNKLRDLSDGNGLDTCSLSCYEDLRDTVETNIWLTRVFYGVGLAAAATGVGLFVWEVVSAGPGDFEDEQPGGSDESAAERIQLAPTLAPDHAGVSLRWTW